MIYPGAPHYYLRCAWCDLNWPNGKAYESCPLCGQETYRLLDDTGLTWDEARKLVAKEQERQARAEDFERYYAEREAARFREELEAL